MNIEYVIIILGEPLVHFLKLLENILVEKN